MFDLRIIQKQLNKQNDDEHTNFKVQTGSPTRDWEVRRSYQKLIHNMGKELQLPVSRVRTIMKSSPDVENIGQDALHLVTKATVSSLDCLLNCSPRPKIKLALLWFDIYFVIVTFKWSQDQIRIDAGSTSKLSVRSLLGFKMQAVLRPNLGEVLM